MAEKKENNIKINFLHGPTQGHNCGYCKNKTGSFTYGFDAPEMSSGLYKSLMDSGWRRCGTYFYKPDLFKSCCNSYTIRMNACQFQIKKSQKKVMKKWNNFIYSEKSILSILEASKGKEESNKPGNMSVEILKKTKEVDYSEQNQQQIDLLASIKAISAELESEWKIKLSYFKDIHEQISFVKPEILDLVKILPSKCEKKGQFFTNYFMIFCARNKSTLPSFSFKALFEELSPILNDLLAKHISKFTCVIDTYSGQISFFNKEKPVDESIKKTIDQQPLIIKDTKNPQSTEKKKNLTKSEEQKNPQKKPEMMQEENDDEEDTEADLKEKKVNFSWLTDTSTCSEIRRGRLRIKIQLAKGDDVNFSMYKKYCSEFHEKEKENFEAFKGFLCEKTLNFELRVSEVDKSQKLLLGCFHMNYYIDDEFFGVGVVDIFEEGLSSVYFFYEPKWKKFSPGVVGAIYEIEYLKILNKYFPKFKYYYLGFYIQNCQKMVYKGDYAPAELLCPRTYKWVELDERIRKQIDQAPKNPSLSSENTEIDQRMSHTISEKVLKTFVETKTKSILQGQVIPFQQFAQFFQAKLKEIFYQIASVIDINTYPTISFSYQQ